MIQRFRTRSKICMTVALLPVYLCFNATAQEVSDTAKQRFIRTEYRQTLDMPDGIALKMLFSYLSSDEKEDEQGLVELAQDKTKLPEEDTRNLLAYLRSLRSDMRQELYTSVSIVACQNENARSSEHRAAATLDLLDDVRVSTYEKYFTYASAQLDDVALAGLQDWIESIKLSSMYVQRDHAAKYKDSSTDIAVTAIDSYCALEGR